jgi:hypothetical protein
MRKQQIVIPTVIAVLVVALGGCAAKPLGVVAPQLSELAPNEGLVYGSFLVVVDSEARVPTGKYAWFGPEDRRTHYELNVHRRGTVGSGVANSHRYVRTRAWEAEPFVAVLPTGSYDAGRMNMYIGTDTRVSKRLVDTKVDFRFNVEPGVATYLGRMVVAVPPKMIPGKTRVSFWVEDHPEADGSAVGVVDMD